MHPQNELLLEFPSLPENVGLARVAVAAFAGQLDFTLAELEEIKVAVSEAVTNCVVHAYDGQPGRVRIVARREGRTLEVVVEDYGRGIDDVERARQPAWSSDPERMGLGFSFMESFMDGIEIDSGPGRGTRVRMWKVCRSEESAGGGTPARGGGPAAGGAGREAAD